jgi:predicted alpha/beta hydrolase family esterase
VGRKWRLTVHGRSVLVADSIGMIHLAVLLANPRQEVRAADLVAGLARPQPGQQRWTVRPRRSSTTRR